jgi:hypothetical protein
MQGRGVREGGAVLHVPGALELRLDDLVAVLQAWRRQDGARHTQRAGELAAAVLRDLRQAEVLCVLVVSESLEEAALLADVLEAVVGQHRRVLDDLRGDVARHAAGARLAGDDLHQFHGHQHGALLGADVDGGQEGKLQGLVALRHLGGHGLEVLRHRHLPTAVVRERALRAVRRGACEWWLR